MAELAPIGAAEGAALLAPLAKASAILLAVAGGPDSVALMGLAAAARDRLPPLLVATVDHGLQSGSGRVADDVMTQAAALGLEAHRLRWEGTKPSSGLQEAARVARYDLLASLATACRASHVATAHTLDDQAETVLFRLMRGSGPAGLAGMRERAAWRGIVVARPFLKVPKARLVATCRAEDWPFVVDAANSNPRFARARLRALMPHLAAEGLDTTTLTRLGERLARDEAALHATAAELHDRALIEERAGCRTFGAAALLGAPAALLVRALGMALADFAAPGPPRLQRLESLADALLTAFARNAEARRTLHGARVRLGADGVLRLDLEGPRRRGAEARGRKP